MTKLFFALLIIFSITPLNVSASSNNLIKIGSIRLTANVVYTTASMKEKALLMDNSPINQGDKLCEAGNAYIAGHSSPTKKNQKAGKVFANLNKLKRGDIVTTTNCKYEIRSIKTFQGKVNEDGISYLFTHKIADYILENTFEKGTLTLQTCTKKPGEILVVKAVKL